MLPELLDVAATLASHGIGTERWHKDLKTLPKASQAKPACLVKLSREGLISAVSLPDNTQLSQLRKWQCGGNGFSFPSFNVPPLYKAYASDKPTKEETDRFDRIRRSVNKAAPGDIAELDSLMTSDCCLWNATQIQRIDKCLHELSSKLLDLTGKPSAAFSPLVSLHERVQAISARDFHDGLTHLFRAALTGSVNATPWFDMIWHGSNKAPGNDISLLIDIDNLLDFGDAFPVQHPQTIRWINAKLLQNQTVSLAQENELDAFGDPADGKDDKLDEITVPGLGKVILRAMSHESPCQYRYRRIGPDSYPVGRTARLKAKAAFEWLITPERKGATWDSISMAAERKEIILAYPSDIPTIPPNLTMLFTGTVPEALQAKRFEECAGQVVASLLALGKPLDRVEVRVFALRKMDRARTQISCHRIFNASQLAMSAEYWRKGCRNIPTIRIRDFSPGKKEQGIKAKVLTLSPQTPFPFEAISCLNTVWSKDLTTPSRTKSFAAADGLELLLDTDVSGLRTRALHAAVTRWPNLLIALRMAILHWQVLALPFKNTNHKQFAPSLLGLLLFASNRTKEKYMQDPPFLIGRVLNLADELHYRYCTHVRSESYPPQLVGNALMTTAMETPIRALALLCQRIMPYQAWARTWQGEDAGLVQYFLSNLRQVCDDLSSVLPTVPDRMSDIDKAELLLGYLASAKPGGPQAADATTENH